MISDRYSPRLCLLVALAALFSIVGSWQSCAGSKTVTIQHNHATNEFATWIQTQIVELDPSISVRLCDSSECSSHHETGRFVKVELKRANRHIHAKTSTSGLPDTSTLFLPRSFIPVAKLPGGYRTTTHAYAIVASAVLFHDDEGQHAHLHREVGDTFMELATCLTYRANWAYERFTAKDTEKQRCKKFEILIFASMRNYLESKSCDDPVCRKALAVTVIALVDIDSATYSEMILPIIKDYGENLDRAYLLLLIQRAMEHGVIDFDETMLCQLYNELEVSSTEQGAALQKAKSVQGCDNP